MVEARGASGQNVANDRCSGNDLCHRQKTSDAAGPQSIKGFSLNTSIRRSNSATENAAGSTRAFGNMSDTSYTAPYTTSARHGSTTKTAASHKPRYSAANASSALIPKRGRP